MFTQKARNDFDLEQKKNFFENIFIKENLQEDIKIILKFQIKNNIDNFYSFGCGNGVLEDILNNYFSSKFKIFGLDSNLEQIKFIKSEMKSEIFKNFNFVEGNYEDLNINKHQTNCAIFSRSLYVCNKQNLHKVLKNLRVNNFKYILDIHDGCHSLIDLIPHIKQNIKKKYFFKNSEKMFEHGYAKHYKDYENILKSHDIEVQFKIRNNKKEFIYGCKIK
jgi:ubiquinone/menaquinone biosynthesis C-methylase UbiE